jgi:transposase
MAETDDLKPVDPPKDVIGVDLGVTTAAAPSDGEPIPDPKAHTVLRGRLRRTSRALSQRTYHCHACGRETDRDLNAARTLMRLAASSPASAWGEERSGAVQKSRMERASVKQESNSSLAAELYPAMVKYV